MTEHSTTRRSVLGLGMAAVVVGVGAGISASPAEAAAASLTLSPASGPAGTAVTVTGIGFRGLTNGTLTCNGTSVALKTLNNGTFTAVITVPATTQTSPTLTAQVGRASASKVFTVVAPTPAMPPISSSPLRFGLIPATAMDGTTELDATSLLVKEQPSIIMGYKDFLQPAPVSALNTVTARGAVPMITWEPWNASVGTAAQATYSLAAIAGGSFDGYIRQWGLDLAAWGKPVMLRFAHEMNGDWYPWCETVNGNQPGDYVRAWRHVHDLISSAGATNVTWVWAPNGGGPGNMAAMYPGDTYVDVLGLDAYNWGTTQTWSSWQAPDALFGYWLDQLRAIAPGKQVIVTETASTETGGSKADWITALMPYLKAQPDVTGFLWFNLNKETDWRINSSTTASSAFAAALAARR